VFGQDVVAGVFGTAAEGRVTLLAAALQGRVAIRIDDTATAVAQVAVGILVLRAVPLFGERLAARDVLGIESTRASSAAAAGTLLAAFDAVGRAIQIDDSATAVTHRTVGIQVCRASPALGSRGLRAAGVVVGVDGAWARPRRTAAFDVAALACVALARVAIGVPHPATAVTQQAVSVEAVVASPGCRDSGTNRIVFLIDGAG